MLSLATIFAVMVVMLMPAPVMAASSGGMLLKNVKQYSYNTTAKKYKLYSKTSYTYEKGYPVEYNTINYSGDSQNVNTVKYKFKKKLPKSAKHYNDIKRNDEKWTYDKKGRITKRVYGYKFWSNQKETRKYKYNKQGFVNQYNYDRTYTRAFAEDLIYREVQAPSSCPRTSRLFFGSKISALKQLLCRRRPLLHPRIRLSDF